MRRRREWLLLAAAPLQVFAQSSSSSSSSGGGGTYSLSVFVCPGGAEQIGTDSSGNQYASCTTGQGSYQNVVIETPWNPSDLNTTEMGYACAAGFTTMATGLIIVMAAKMVLKATRG